MSDAETFARWVFDQMADGGDCPEDGMIDKLEELGMVEPRQHLDGPGVSVSMFWKDLSPQPSRENSDD